MVEADAEEAAPLITAAGTAVAAVGEKPAAVPKAPAARAVDAAGPHKHDSGATSSAKPMLESGLVSVLLLKPDALLQQRLVLRSVVEFGGLMMWVYLCDRTAVFPAGEKSYSRDLFWFLYLILTVVAGMTSIKVRPAARLSPSVQPSTAQHSHHGDDQTT